MDVPESPVKGGILHKYTPDLLAFEHPTLSGKPHDNILLFVGGLGDGLGTVPYVSHLAQELDSIGWGVVEILTRSSYLGWGIGSLVKDCEDITEAILYFKSKPGGGSKSKIVLQGHSTGCQDTMYYLTQQYSGDDNDISNRPKLAGAVLQASVSDREAYLTMNSKDVWNESLVHAKSIITDSTTDANYEVMPYKYCKTFFGAPISATRWKSLLDVRGDDDFFSSDLDETDFAKTFGKVSDYGLTGKLLLLYSGADEFVPESVDKKQMVEKWKNSTSQEIWSKYSGVVNGATHNCGPTSQSGALEDLVSRVKSFVSEF